MSQSFLFYDHQLELIGYSHFYLPVHQQKLFKQGCTYREVKHIQHQNTHTKKCTGLQKLKVINNSCVLVGGFSPMFVSPIPCSLRHSLQKMKLHHSRMLQDLSRKQEALSLEQRSMNTRTRLTSPSCSEKTPVLLVPLTNSSGRRNLQLLAQ